MKYVAPPCSSPIGKPALSGRTSPTQQRTCKTYWIYQRLLVIRSFNNLRGTSPKTYYLRRRWPRPQEGSCTFSKRWACWHHSTGHLAHPATFRSDEHCPQGDIRRTKCGAHAGDSLPELLARTAMSKESTKLTELWFLTKIYAVVTVFNHCLVRRMGVIHYLDIYVYNSSLTPMTCVLRVMGGILKSLHQYSVVRLFGIVTCSPKHKHKRLLY